MGIYRLTLKKSDGGDSWGDYNFTFTAKSDKDAYRKACEITDSWNIEKIVLLRWR